jgi:hypothetical protein
MHYMHLNNNQLVFHFNRVTAAVTLCTAGLAIEEDITHRLRWKATSVETSTCANAANQSATSLKKLSPVLPTFLQPKPPKFSHVHFVPSIDFLYFLLSWFVPSAPSLSCLFLVGWLVWLVGLVGSSPAGVALFQVVVCTATPPAPPLS